MIYETRDLLGMHHRIQYRRRIQVGPCDGFILRDGGGEGDFNVRGGDTLGGGGSGLVLVAGDVNKVQIVIRM